MRSNVRSHAPLLVAVTALATAAVGWRAWRNGASRVASGPAFEPWRNWDRTGGERGLVQSAILAASAHNTQPWRFRWSEGTLFVDADPARHIGSFDPFRREMHQSIGCALENLALAARAFGMAADVELPAGSLTLAEIPPPPAAIVTLRPGEQTETGLFRAIPSRHTHRGPYRPDRAVPEHVAHELQDLVLQDPTMRLLLFRGSDRRALADLIVSSTRAIVFDREMSKDSARWFRFRRPEIARHRDGLTLDTNVTAPLQNLAAKLFPPSAVRADRHWLHDTETVQLRTAPLLGIIAVRTPYDRPTAIRAGRLWQRLHLLLTARGLDAQPLNQPIERVDRERALDRPPGTAEALARITGDAAWLPTFVFRAGYGVRKPAASPRRPLGEVLTIA